MGSILSNLSDGGIQVFAFGEEMIALMRSLLCNCKPDKSVTHERWKWVYKNTYVCHGEIVEDGASVVDRKSLQEQPKIKKRLRSKKKKKNYPPAVKKNKKKKD